VGDVPGGADAVLDDSNWVFVTNGSTVNVVQGVLNMTGATGTYPTGDPSMPDADLELYASGLLQVSTDGLFQTAHGTYVSGGAGVNTMADGHGQTAQIRSDLRFVTVNNVAGWLGVDQQVGGQAVTGTGNANTGLSVTGTVRLGAGVSVRVNEDFSLATPPSQIKIEGDLSVWGNCSFAAVNQVHAEMRPAAGAWNVMEVTGTVYVGSNTYHDMGGGSNLPGPPWLGAYRGKPNPNGSWFYGLYLADASIPSWADEHTGAGGGGG
jgi:hypothetical protein